MCNFVTYWFLWIFEDEAKLLYLCRDPPTTEKETWLSFIICTTGTVLFLVYWIPFIFVVCSKLPEVYRDII